MSFLIYFGFHQVSSSKIYQRFDTLFHHISKLLKLRQQKYSALRLLLDSLLAVVKLSLKCLILLKNIFHTKKGGIFLFCQETHFRSSSTKREEYMGWALVGLGILRDSQFSFKGVIPKGDLVYRQYCLLPAPKHILKIIISYFPGGTRFPYRISISFEY